MTRNLSDADRLSRAMTECSILLLELIGMKHEDGDIPPSLDPEKVPCDAWHAAKGAAGYPILGVAILDESKSAPAELVESLDAEFARLLGGAT